MDPQLQALLQQLMGQSYKPQNYGDNPNGPSSGEGGSQYIDTPAGRLQLYGDAQTGYQANSLPGNIGGGTGNYGINQLGFTQDAQGNLVPTGQGQFQQQDHDVGQLGEWAQIASLLAPAAGGVYGAVSSGALTGQGGAALAANGTPIASGAATNAAVAGGYSDLGVGATQGVGAGGGGAYAAGGADAGLAGGEGLSLAGDTGPGSTTVSDALNGGAVDPGVTAPPADGSGLPAWLTQALGQAGMPLAGLALGALGGSKGTTTTNSTAVDPALASYMQQYRDRASQVADTPFTPYTGQLTAGMNDTQRSAGGAFQSQVDNIPGLRAKSQGLIDAGTAPLTAANNDQLGDIKAILARIGTTQQAAVNPYATADNPYLQGAIGAANRGLVDTYNTVSAPKYSQGSSFGNSGLAQYEALDRENLQKQLADNANQLSYAGYQQSADLSEKGAGRQDALTALAQQLSGSGAQLLGQLGESQASRTDQINTGNSTRALQGSQILGNNETQYAGLINNLLGYGNQQQQTEQGGLDAQYQEFLRKIQYPQQQLGILAGGLGANPGSTSTGTTPGNTLTGALGGGLLGAQIQRLLNQQGGSGGLQQPVSAPNFTGSNNGSSSLFSDDLFKTGTVN